MGDCAGGEGPAVDGVLAEGGGGEFGIASIISIVWGSLFLFVERQAVEAVDAAWIFACRKWRLFLVHICYCRGGFEMALILLDERCRSVADLNLHGGTISSHKLNPLVGGDWWIRLRGK